MRGESLLLGEQAKGADLVLPARLEKITYRGVYRDYRLRLDDGQELSATLTQRLPLAEGSRVEVGIRADEIVLLEEDLGGAALAPFEQRDQRDQGERDRR